jgi:hypothetical protein
MRTIYKYHLLIQDDQDIAMHIGAEILKVDTIGNEIYLWAIVDSEEPMEVRHFKMYGTGHKLHDETAQEYIGTAILFDGRLVLHVFE